jgi:hypothetical protein
MVLLSLINVWVNYWGGLVQIIDTVRAGIGLINRFIPAPFPFEVERTAIPVNLALTQLWFEPFVMRLNLLRGAAWIGLRLSPYFLMGILHYYVKPWMLLLGTFLSLIAVYPALRGWRIRPWMCAVGAIVGCGIFAVTASYLRARGVHLLLTIGPMCAYAIPLLWGTRLLRPEERAASVA